MSSGAGKTDLEEQRDRLKTLITTLRKGKVQNVSVAGHSLPLGTVRPDEVPLMSCADYIRQLEARIRELDRLIADCDRVEAKMH